MKKILFIISLCISFVANADVWKTTDKDGNVSYSSSQSPGSKKVELQSVTITNSVKPPVFNKKTEPANNNIEAKPVNKRKAILEEELAVANKELKFAQEQLQTGQETRNGNEKNYAIYQERIKGLKQKVTEAENKVNALTRELQADAQN